MFTQNLCVKAYSSFIRKSQKLETIQMFFSGWMVKTAVPPHQEYYSAIKVNELLIHTATLVECKGFMLSEKR